MVIISDTSEIQSVYFPKTKEGNPTAIRLYSELTHYTNRFAVEDISDNKLYYQFSLDFSDVPNGEYEYTIYNVRNEVLEEGLIRLGEVKDGSVIYSLTETYTIYNPETGEGEIIYDNSCEDVAAQAFSDGYVSGTTDGYSSGYTDGYAKGQEECESCGWINVETPFNIPASATQINYRIRSNMPFDMTAYVMNWENGNWTEYAPTIHSETSPYDGTLQIPENESSGVMEYMIAAGLDDECATHYEAYVIQAPSSDAPVPPTPPTPSGYTSTRFSVEMYEDGDINWEGRGSEYYDIIRDGVRDEGYQLYHSIDGLLAGDIVEFYVRADNTNPINTPLTSTAKHNVYGNIMSLIYVDFESVSATTMQGQFSNLFKDDTNLTDAENLVIPACGNMYEFVSMFEGCTSLVNAPKTLYGDVIGAHTCDSMFKDCTSLVKAPILPATTVGVYAYWSMFEGCTSLVNAPSLPATNLSPECYSKMFNGCTSLVNAPELPATTLFFNCYAYMFYGCTSLVNAPALPATTLENECYYTMFGYCTSLVNAPELPATTLVDKCYMQMFFGCSSLNYIKCLATDISATDCTKNWTNGVARLGTFVKPFEMKDWAYGNDGIPSTWLVETE